MSHYIINDDVLSPHCVFACTNCTIIPTPSRSLYLAVGRCGAVIISKLDFERTATSLNQAIKHSFMHLCASKIENSGNGYSHRYSQYILNCLEGFLSEEQKNFDGPVSTLDEQFNLNAKKKRREKPSAERLVLLKCQQRAPKNFQLSYNARILSRCQKIGEGVYGEVFLLDKPNGYSSVMKIIPIEGNQMVNGEPQKKFNEILSEIVIASELSDLRDDDTNQTSGFTEVIKVQYLKGKYPQKLIELWENYDKIKNSENDHPGMFDKDQLYIVLELANGGKDLESYVFQNAKQSLSIFNQIACTLAVGESAMQFEHRDLHWGNVLVDETDDKYIDFRMEGINFKIKTNGLKVCIIDFTLSRIKHDGCILFNDLSLDPDLFKATGDYQFDIYRFMRDHLKNDWKTFEPYTNILWLHYILDKMITQLRYEDAATNDHWNGLMDLRKIKEDILNYKSTMEFVKDKFL